MLTRSGIGLLLFCALGMPGRPQNTAAPQQAPAASSSQTKSPEDATASSATPAVPDSTRLEPVKMPRPVYPLAAREKRLQGQVLVKLLISETGDVEEVETVSGEPILAQAAADAFKKWKFKPYIKNGKAIKVKTQLPFDFAFAENVTDVRDKSATAKDPNSPDTARDQGPDSGDQAPTRVRVSSGVLVGLLIHKVNPVYPREALRDHIQGSVILAATISKEGRLKNIRLVSGNPDLARAAMDAVAQWRYRPYLLKGEPVEVETTIKIDFRL